MPRLVRAEVLKLRRRRGLLALTAVLTIVPILLGYGAAVIAHLVDAKAHGPAGGLENMSSPLEILACSAASPRSWSASPPGPATSTPASSASSS